MNTSIVEPGQSPRQKQSLVGRSEAVTIARSFLGTPYALAGRVKGGGLDCGTLLAEWLIEIGAASREDLENLGLYSHDWFCHESSERYMLRLMRYAKKTAETICRGTQDAQPGCLVLFRVVKSKRFNHGGIVTKWPRIVHASEGKVRESNATTHWMTGFHDMAIFDPWSNEC